MKPECCSGLCLAAMLATGAVGACGGVRTGAGREPAASAGADTSAPQYRTYWLLRLDPVRGCDACYVPLLFVKEPIEAVKLPISPAASGKRGGGARLTPDELVSLPALILLTYEKDSIWNTDCAPFKAATGLTAVHAADRTLVMDGVRYTYQVAARAEVITLLKNPEGKKPIHRLVAPTCGAGEVISRLLTSLGSAESGKPIRQASW